jgi:hypothetical protein
MRSPPPPASDEQALALVRAQDLPVETDFVPLARFITRTGEPEAPFAIAALVSEVLSGEDAIALWRHFRDWRGESGLTPVIVEEEAWECLMLLIDAPPWPQGRAVRDELEAIESRPASAIFEGLALQPAGGQSFALEVRERLRKLEQHVGEISPRNSQPSTSRSSRPSSTPSRLLLRQRRARPSQARATAPTGSLELPR